jgi:proteic killer suppression protein
MIRQVQLTRDAQKDLHKAPAPIVAKFRIWVDDVEHNGLEQTRKRPGYHDEPLRGNRSGQRSIRLNRSWRAIYEVRGNGELAIVQVQEVNKHDY